MKYAKLLGNEVLVNEHCVGRVIARPFIGKNKQYIRTQNRRDYAVKPPAKTILDILSEDNIKTAGIGKIDDLFCGCGLQEKFIPSRMRKR